MKKKTYTYTLICPAIIKDNLHLSTIHNVEDWKSKPLKSAEEVQSVMAVSIFHPYSHLHNPHYAFIKAASPIILLEPEIS